MKDAIVSKHRQVVLVKLDQFHTRCDRHNYQSGFMKMLHQYAATRHGIWIGKVLEWSGHRSQCILINDFFEFLDRNSISGSARVADHFVVKLRWSGEMG
jgi:hypothetical protein